MSNVLKKLLNKLFSSGAKNKKETYGPTNLNELLKQFDQPKKQKTPQQLAMDIYYQEKFAEVELDYLKDQPDTKFQGSWKINNADGTIDIDFVPVTIRPEVVFCCHGKN